MEDGEMSVAILGVLLPIIITLGAFVMVVYLRKFENMERMAVIDKGLSPDLFTKNRVAPTTMRWALLLVGGGIGLLMGYWLDRSFNMQEVAYFSMVLIFGGLGLGLAYLIEERRHLSK